MDKLLQRIIRLVSPDKWRAVLLAVAFSTNANAVDDDGRIVMVTFGDSVMWGQGLTQDKKISSLVKQHMEQDRDTRVLSLNLSHSGAKIGVGLDSPERWPGEVPSTYPTILQQVQNFEEYERTKGISREQVDIVVVNGCINDIGVTKILAWLPAHTSKLAARYCYTDLVQLIRSAAKKFPHAKVLVPGYYSVITEGTPMLSAQDYWGLFGVNGLLMRDVMITRWTNARVQMNDNMQLAVKKVNRDKHLEFVFFVDPKFRGNNGMGAEDALLWPVIEAGDPVAAQRKAECEKAHIKHSPLYTKCARASAGHPNFKGARRYASNIYQVIREQKFLAKLLAQSQGVSE